MGAFLLRNEEVPADRMNHLAPTNKVFMAGDGRHLTLGIIEDHFWQRFCVLTGRKDLQADPRYSTHQARIENGPSLISELKAVFLLKDRDSWLAELRQADIPCGPVNSVYEAAGDPQLKNRGMIRELTVDTDKKIRYVPYPVKFVNCESGETIPPPSLGRDTKEVLRDVGLSEEEVMMLSEEEVI
jgi:crotonobetainyl-CoA:carnitine CoA-transferase CaiB-like acyl-CoA transferase